MKDRITYWQKELEISDWEITTERISPDQVTYPIELICDKYFIGIVKDHRSKTATIYHDVDLCENAIIHELLHVRYPTRSEDWVNKKTEELKKYGLIQRCKKCGTVMSMIHSKYMGNCNPKKKQKKWKNSYI